MNHARSGATMSPGLKPNRNIAIVEGSAKSSDHLIRTCTTCGRVYVAPHYFALHCDRSISDTQAAKEARRAGAKRYQKSNRPQ
jgi:hypothetical protein